MKTDMTKDVGFDEFYESGGAVEPEEVCCIVDTSSQRSGSADPASRGCAGGQVAPRVRRDGHEGAQRPVLGAQGSW